MHRTPFFTLTSLRRLSVRALAGAVVCGCAAAAHATTAADGLAISGSPPRSVTVGQTYSFTPTTANPKKRTLSFRIWDKPRWLTFSTTTGRLSGTPTAADVGTSSREYSHWCYGRSLINAYLPVLLRITRVDCDEYVRQAIDLRNAAHQRDRRQHLQISTHRQGSGRQDTVVLRATQARLGDFQHRHRASRGHAEQYADRGV